MYYTYILKSEKSSRWYYGHSDDPERRLKNHNTGQNKSTKNKGPWQIIFLRPFQTKKAANQFELYLKKLKNKSYIRKVYSAYFLPDSSGLIGE